MKRLVPLILFCCAGCAATPPPDTPAPSAVEQSDTNVPVAEDANKAIASGVSGSDIWLGKLNRGPEWSISDLYNITTRQGYDNQPAFTANGSGIYYTSIRDGAQADIYLFEHSIRAGFRFTATPQSEFSPMALPAGDGISIVRVEADGKQSLWRYAGSQPLPLLANVDNLGYYTWLDAQTVAMFLVTEPPTLALASVPNGRIETIHAQPGRSLHLMPATGALSFIDTSDESAWWISLYDRSTGAIQRIAPTLEGSEDFAWTPDGELLMAQGKKIYRWRKQWQEAVDLSGSIPGDITRISIGPRGSQIVFVASEGGR